MAKQRSEIDILRSITKALDGLTAEARTRILNYLSDKYEPNQEAQGK